MMMLSRFLRLRQSHACFAKLLNIYKFIFETFQSSLKRTLNNTVQTFLFNTCSNNNNNNNQYGIYYEKCLLNSKPNIKSSSSPQSNELTKLLRTKNSKKGTKTNITIDPKRIHLFSPPPFSSFSSYTFWIISLWLCTQSELIAFQKW